MDRATGARLVDVLRAGFVLWAIAELVAGERGEAVALLVMFAVLLVPRFFALPIGLQLANVVAWTLQALGQVAGFWGSVEWWDTLVHLVLPAVLAPTALLVLLRLDVLPGAVLEASVRRRLGLFVLSFLVAAGFGAGYEVYEWLSDEYVGTTYQPSNDDTMTDTSANLLGGLLGASALVLFAGRREGRPA